MCERLQNKKEYSESSPAADDPSAKRKSYSPVIGETRRARVTAACQEAHEWGEKFMEYLNAHPEILAHLD